MPEQSEYGPFGIEEEIWATGAYRRIRAAFDANPGYGASVPEALTEMTSACEHIGIEIGALDLSTLKDIAWRETFEAVCIAGLLRRAYEAGKAAPPEGLATEWAIAYTTWPGKGVPSRREIQPYPDEATAREAVTEIRRAMPQDEPALVCRQAGPWKEVPDA